jgi:hypothetical protein
MSLREYSGSFVWPVAIIIAISIVVVCAVIWLLFGSVSARAADNDPPCLTKVQAQAKWPGQWLYWHTANRCWDNVNVRSTHSRAVAAAIVSRPATWGKQNSLKLPKPNPDPNGNVGHHSGRPIIPVEQAGPTVFYPTLMTGPGTVNDMLYPEQMTTWPLVVDFDADPPQFIPWQQRIAFTKSQ